MSPRPHFLVLTFPLQGHIAPALRLARRLLAAAPDALVTFSTTEAGHRRMSSATPDAPDDDGRLELLPFSDGTETGYVRSSDAASFNDYMASFHSAGARSVGDLLNALAARGRPVTRVVYTMLLPWAADVARSKGVPSALYWIQPAAVLAIYYHYFHGHAAVVAEHRHDPSFLVRLPGLPPQAIRDLPSFVTDPSDFYHCVYVTTRDLFDALDRETPRATVVINTCQELEAATLAALGAYTSLPIGPVLPAGDEACLFKQDDARYIEWLDAKPANSVLYVSFGSLARMAKEQLYELLLGLEESGRPYLLHRPEGQQGGARRGGAGAGRADQERHGGGVVRPGAGALARGGGLLRDALRMELGAGDRGQRRADGVRAPNVRPTDERVARRVRVARRNARGGGNRRRAARGRAEAASRGGDARGRAGNGGGVEACGHRGSGERRLVRS